MAAHEGTTDTGTGTLIRITALHCIITLHGADALSCSSLTTGTLSMYTLWHFVPVKLAVSMILIYNFFGSSSKFIEAHRGACEVLNMT